MPDHEERARGKGRVIQNDRDTDFALVLTM